MSGCAMVAPQADGARKPTAFGARLRVSHATGARRTSPARVARALTDPQAETAPELAVLAIESLVEDAHWSDRWEPEDRSESTMCAVARALNALRESLRMTRPAAWEDGAKGAGMPPLSPAEAILALEEILDGAEWDDCHPTSARGARGLVRHWLRAERATTALRKRFGMPRREVPIGAAPAPGRSW